MDVSQLVQQKLDELGLEQRDLANAAEVTESYISQLLSRKKMPPAPDRTDIYDKLGRFLRRNRSANFLKPLRFKNRRRPTALYYYHELQTCETLFISVASNHANVQPHALNETRRY